jgi:hypothetical protein
MTDHDCIAEKRCKIRLPQGSAMSKTLAGMALIAASAVMFVVVCPLTATPAAVPAAKAGAPLLAGLFLWALMLSALAFNRTAFPSINSRAIHSSEPSLVDFICARLC